MGADVLSFEVAMYNRRNGIGKNLTNSELKSRQQESEKLKSKNVKMSMPEWLKNPQKERAQQVWVKTLNSVQDIELFANCDSEMLATYCDICIQYEDATLRRLPYPKDIDRLGKLKMTYAEKLGLTPTSRARLVVSRAKKNENSAGKESMFD